MTIKQQTHDLVKQTMPNIPTLEITVGLQAYYLFDLYNNYATADQVVRKQYQLLQGVEQHLGDFVNQVGDQLPDEMQDYFAQLREAINNLNKQVDQTYFEIDSQQSDGQQ